MTFILNIDYVWKEDKKENLLVVYLMTTTINIVYLQCFDQEYWMHILTNIKQILESFSSS